MTPSEWACEALLEGLRRGDFSRLEPWFVRQGQVAPPILGALDGGCFDGHPDERAEALTCACFLGAVEVAERLLADGVPAAGGMMTGLNALHWATNRGQPATTRLLLRHGAALEVRNMYGGTVLGGTTWSLLHEPRAAHLAIVEELLRAGADVREADYPTGDARLDALLERFGRAHVEKP